MDHVIVIRTINKRASKCKIYGKAFLWSDYNVIVVWSNKWVANEYLNDILQCL